MKSRIRRTSASIDVTFAEQSGSDEAVHSHNSKSLDVCPHESRIDRMRKLLSSPLLRRKPNDRHKHMSQISQSESKVFGVSLDVLSHSSANTSESPYIPYVITRLCHFIEDSGGLLQEGLFRISGNAKIIDKLKHSFDTTGDANLETEGDIASASALLKLFLRELPQPLITDTSDFLDAIKSIDNVNNYHDATNAASMAAYETDRVKCVHNLRSLVARLPDENYYTLKYLSAFLNRIALQKENRMTSANLGIVFAPNIFRVNVDNYKGLRDQSIANEVVSLFITNCSEVFSSDSDDTGYQSMCPLTVQIPDLGPTSSETGLRGEMSGLLLQNSLLEKENYSNRKRKECKCGSNSPPLRSNSEETLSDSKDLDIRRCSSDENVLNNGLTSAVNKLEDLSFRNIASPHPPEAKRRELDNDVKKGDIHSDDETDCFKENVDQKCDVFSDETALGKDMCDKFESDDANIENQIAGQIAFKSYHSSQFSEERNSRPLLEITPSDNVNPKDKNKCELKEKIPHLDFKTMYQNSESSEPMLSEHRYSWPRTAHESEGSVPPESQMIGPPNSVSQFLKKAVSYEAPLSPSAYRSYLSNRKIHLDPTVPPSPPVEQQQCFTPPIRDTKHLETTNTSIRSITKKIQNIKKKIKNFEHDFDREHGFRPSLEQKMNSPEVRNYINEMNKLKKDLKEFKDDLYMEIPDQQNPMPDETKEFHCNKSLLNISEAIREIERTIEEKRKHANRPEILDEMSSEEVVEEKLTLQKSLLRFEAHYGRPSTKAERDIVRPLYDRYRIVKRLVAKQTPPKHGNKDSAELQPILEHIAMDFTSPSHSKSKSIASPVKSDSGVGAIDDDSKPSVKDLQNIPCNNLHEMSLSELNQLLGETRVEKKNLRTVLKDFENDFLKLMGRKAEKEDKVNMGSVYINYKHTKGKLRLLEALVSKHESQVIMF